MNVQLTRDKIKDNPFAMLAIMAGIAAVICAMLIYILYLGMDGYSKKMNVYLEERQKEETRKQERCEAANGQYVQYDGVMTCLALPFDPTRIKER